MKIIDNGKFITIQADEGMILNRDDCFTHKAHLGCNDSVDNWTEISEDAALKLQEEVEEFPIE